MKSILKRILYAVIFAVVCEFVYEFVKFQINGSRRDLVDTIVGLTIFFLMRLGTLFSPEISAWFKRRKQKNQEPK